VTVLLFERYPVAAAATSDFASLLGELLADVREQPGLLWADAARAMDDDPSFIVASEWRTDGDAQRWAGGEEARVFAERADVHLRGEVTRRRFRSEDQGPTES
jgi:heme-degrading monooxygenase HmoA